MDSFENWDHEAHMYKCVQIYNSIFMSWLEVHAGHRRSNVSSSTQQTQNVILDSVEK